LGAEIIAFKASGFPDLENALNHAAANNSGLPHKNQEPQMNEKRNVQIVQLMYAAIEKRDIQNLLTMVSDEVDWQTFGPSKIAHAGPHRGRDQVRRFFATMAETLDITQFEPREFIAQGDNVVVLGNYAGRVKATGRQYASEWAHMFALRHGKVIQFREYADTANLAAAY
jgi:ketosteroid isomerase-like protein